MASNTAIKCLALNYRINLEGIYTNYTGFKTILLTPNAALD